MAEFSETMRQVQRMCDYRLKRGLKCNDCDAVHICEHRISHVGLDTLCADADAVMAWAAEHPVVYPTWREYLTSIGVIPKTEILPTGKNEFVYSDFSEAFALTNTRIPADIAEKLGLEPKNG